MSCGSCGYQGLRCLRLQRDGLRHVYGEIIWIQKQKNQNLILTTNEIYGNVRQCEEHDVLKHMTKQSIRSHLTAIEPVSVHDIDFIHRQEAALCSVSESG